MVGGVSGVELFDLHERNDGNNNRNNNTWSTGLSTTHHHDSSPGVRTRRSAAFRTCATPEAEAAHRGGDWTEPASRIPLGAMDVLWYYNGSGVVPQGYADPDEIREDVQGVMDELGATTLTPAVLLRGH